MKKVWLVFTLVAVALLGFAAVAQADSTFNVSGIYGSSTVSEPLSGPGESFTMSFTIPTRPVVTDFLLGDDFFVNPVTVAYSLNGGSLISLTNVFVIFYTPGASTQSGGFFVDFCATDPSCLTGSEYQWTFAGPQQYTGSEDAPTMKPIGFAFAGPQSGFAFGGVNELLPPMTPISGRVGVVSTPEPSALVLLLAGLAAATIFLKRLRG
jgi:hypothetical protein